MNRLCLAPDIQEEILLLLETVRGGDAITEKQLRPIASIPSWHRQRQLWGDRNSTHKYEAILITTDSCGTLRGANKKGAIVSTNSKKITVLLNEADFHRFDQFCRDRGFKKSTLLVRLIREFMDREFQEDMPLFDARQTSTIDKR
jgi:hypothetical protein